MTRSYLLSLLLCLAAQGPALAAGPGTTAANFLKIPVGARETSLGGAFTAVADNANAVFYNPAGLGLLEVPEVSYAYNNYFPGVSQQWLAAAYPAAGGALGLGVNYLGVAAFDSYDNADNRTGSVSASDLAVYLGYGGRLRTGYGPLPSLRYGAAVKYIAETLDSSRAAGYGLDAGLLLLPRVKNLGLGLGFENLASSRMDFIRGGARPASRFKAGASYLAGSPGSAAAALLSVDLNYPEDGHSYLSAGIENTLYGALTLRAGYSSFGDVSNGLSFGLGFSLPRRGGRELRLDYSYGTTYDFGNIHKFGLACKFGPAAAARAAKPPPAPPAPAERTAQSLDLLYGENPAASLAAAEALARAGGPMVLEHFNALLSSGKTGWKLAAVRGLSLLKDGPSRAALEGALSDQEQEVRRQAALALGGRGEAASAPALLEALKSEESHEVKSALLEALGRLSPQARERPL